MTKLQLATFSAAYTAYVIMLHTVDGPWRNWTIKGKGPTLDAWSLTHLTWGVIGQKFGISLPALVGLSALNEAGEAYLRHIKFLGLWGEPESNLNILTDVASTAAGWYAATMLTSD